MHVRHIIISLFFLNVSLVLGAADPYEKKINDKIQMFEKFAKENAKPNTNKSETKARPTRTLIKEKRKQFEDPVKQNPQPEPSRANVKKSIHEDEDIEELRRAAMEISQEQLSTFAPMSLEMEKEYFLDQEYDAFIKEMYPVERKRYHEEDFHTTTDPENDFTLIYPHKTPNPLPHFAPGSYATFDKPFSPNVWLEKIDTYNYKNVPQGWKIHISATPRSAKKIAQIVLPLIDKVDGLKGKFVSHKIAISLPHLRALNGMVNVQGDETQAGKFLVIYPDSHEHYCNLIRVIDSIFLRLMADKILDASDFFPIKGDVRVGNSGGVYVRYGAFAGTSIAKVNPKGKHLPFKTPEGKKEGVEMTLDNRKRPWPDFMNKQEKQWKGAPSPFCKLPIRWESFYHPENKVEDWKERPTSWKRPVEKTE